MKYHSCWTRNKVIDIVKKEMKKEIFTPLEQNAVSG